MHCAITLVHMLDEVQIIITAQVCCFVQHNTLGINGYRCITYFHFFCWQKFAIPAASGGARWLGFSFSSWCSLAGELEIKKYSRLSHQLRVTRVRAALRAPQVSVVLPGCSVCTTAHTRLSNAPKPLYPHVPEIQDSYGLRVICLHYSELCVPNIWPAHSS